MNRFSFSRPFLVAALLAGAGSLSTTKAASRSGPSPDGLWQLQAAAPAARSDREVAVPAKRLQAFTADLAGLRAVLAKAPLDQTTAKARGTASKGAPVEISLPMPRKGKFARFRMVEVDIMEPALAARFPGIKTYRGVGLDDRGASVALDVSPYGFHAQIMSPSGWVYISPYYPAGQDDVYASYRKQDAVMPEGIPWVCETHTALTPRVRPDASLVADPETTISGTLRTYRLAVAANSFYVAANGGTTASTIAAIVVVINRVSAIYETEVAVRMVLVGNNGTIIYPTAASDPFAANDTSVISTSTSVISAAIGAANYDVGHVFTTGSGGVSGLGVVCNTSTKGRSTTGLPTPYGDAYSVDFVAHEIGHEFAGNHTFNSNTLNCGGGNRSNLHAYEVGSGNTIMAYAGICGASDLQPHSDAYFHSESIREILVFTTTAGGAACAASTANTNGAAVVSAGSNYTIPLSTPFTLVGSAVDPDGDTLTYCWEEFDRGAAQAGNPVDNGASPIFRSFNPVYSAARTFPKVSDLLNNTTTIGEQLPTVARAAMTFRLTVRDNRANGGATNSADCVLTTVAGTGPFLVTAPNTAITAPAGSPLAVTWNVAGTSVPPINTSNVNILLSVDGGYTYPYTLAAGTANDGAETVTLPAGVTTATARVKVAAAGNIYFDISNVNFAIN